MNFAQRQRHLNNMFGSCPSKLDGEMLPLHFGFFKLTKNQYELRVQHFSARIDFKKLISILSFR